MDQPTDPRDRVETVARSRAILGRMDERDERRPPHWQEGRRLRARELPEEGWSGMRIAEALGVTRGAVSQWTGAGTGRRSGSALPPQAAGREGPVDRRAA